MEDVKLVNLKPEAGIVLTKELKNSLPLQKIEVIKTIKKINRTDVKPDGTKYNDWQGYLIRFTEDDVVLPISGGLILAASERDGVEAYLIDTVKKDKQYELIIKQMGYNKETNKFFLVKQ
jgi:hypothetical protein